jgi:hypothetical protein
MSSEEKITFGKAFYARQVSLLEAGDVAGLVASQYLPDAELLGYDLHVQGSQALLKHFSGYLAQLGGLKLISTDKFMETDQGIMFEASVQVAAGVAHVYDIFVFKDGKAAHHFTGMLGFTPNP